MTKKSATRRNVVWGMSSLSALVLLFGYHTSTGTAEASTVTAATPSVPAGSTSSGSSSSGSSSSGSSSTGEASAAASAPTTSGTSTSGTSTSDSASGTSSSGTSAGGSDSSASSTTVIGEAAQTRWGPVQVQLTVTDGKVTAVDVLQQPDENRKDQEINARALPILVQETLSAQSAQIDVVSGATYTSDGYTTSLQSALDQAGLA